MKGKFDTKYLCEDCWTLDIRELNDLGLFSENIGEITQIMNPPTGRDGGRISVWARTAVDWQGRFYIDVTYPAYTGNTPEADEFDYSILTYPVKCARGGERLYQCCPFEKEEGSTCNKTVQILYLPPGEKMLGCRDCHRLVHFSTRKPKTSSPSRFMNPGAAWELEFNSEFQRLKNQYGIGNSESLAIQVSSGSIISSKDFESESERLIYSMAQCLGISYEEFKQMNRRAEINAPLIEDDEEYLNKHFPKK
jgi:hypothetical protein